MSGHVKSGEIASNISNEEWKRRLNPEVYSVTRDGGTERVNETCNYEP